MRHKVRGRHLSRTSEHRLAMRRNMASSLFEHETISTTVPKAKEVRRFAEKLISLAKKGDLAARRRAIALLNDRGIFEDVDGEMVKKGTVIGKLFSEIGPKYLDRPGGYTRIIKLSKRRIGDASPLCLLQLVEAGSGKEEKTPKKKAKPAAAPKAEKAAAEEAPAQSQEPATEAEQAPEPEAAEEKKTQ
ncbi:50S ribosomal protein L17 [Limihaloglobus sulfuriphilus]|uniref:Large ribosomal subunit protein bL17 n=1 Tax=Limihaloglobus sulfuriphilus TaxID=1851148 RepID=A0A1Q2MH64_9BACT|nr:50S ribosomal protein L17 [Limihaloglobus sulfuriphilus]